MKIKRFEAPNMSEALRMIRKEFGEEAVILSAKAVKKTRGVFGSRKFGQVMVTAAIDRTVKTDTDETPSEPYGAVVDTPLSENREDAGDRLERTSAIFDRYTPITRTGQQKLRSKFVRLMGGDTRTPETPSPGLKTELARQLAKQGVRQALIDDVADQAAGLLSAENAAPKEMCAALSQVIAAKGLVSPALGKWCDSGRSVVLVGPSGVGKTTLAARLAAQAALKTRRVAIISMDDQRIAGAAELERYAQLMTIPMFKAFDETSLKAALERIDTTHVVIVDTPGIGIACKENLDHLKKMVGRLPDPTVHLLINATARGGVMENTIAFFKPLAPAMLAFTQLDWAERYGDVFNLIVEAGLAVSFLSNTGRVTDGIEPATAMMLAGLLLETGDASEPAPQVTVIGNREDAATGTTCFVANSNSDIFHRSHCRSVQRISSDNIVMFKNEAEAIGRRFKACRMCCADLFAPKPIERPALGSVAGNRYYTR